MSGPLPRHPLVLDYVIRITPGSHRRYLAPDPEEDDGEPVTSPPTTAFPELALRFKVHSEARAAVAAAVKRFPGHAFMLDVTDLSEQPKAGA